jgi:hypothetical protein
MPSRRRWIWIGLIVVAVGLWEGKDGLDSYKTGEPVHGYNRVEHQWWEELGFAVLTVLFGLLVIASGLGWIKPRGDRPL